MRVRGALAAKIPFNHFAREPEEDRRVGLNRRQALLFGVAAATGLGAATGLVRSAHAEPDLRFINVHHHFTPPGRQGAYVSPIKPWSRQGSLEEMDRSGVATSIGYLGFIALASRFPCWTAPGRFLAVSAWYLPKPTMTVHRRSVISCMLDLRVRPLSCARFRGHHLRLLS
jgi:hypothetical protein